MKLMARICFRKITYAELGIAALRRAGFTVLMRAFPEEPDYWIFAEAMRDDDDSSKDVYELSDKMLLETRRVVEPFGGDVSDAGRIPIGHVPFSYEGDVWRDDI